MRSNRSNRTELLALLDLIQPCSGAFLEWCSKNRSVAQRTRANFIFAAHPSENEVVRQHVGNQFIVRLVEIVLCQIDRASRNEAKARVNVPIDFRIPSKMELGVNRRADGRARIVGNRGNENLRKEIGLSPLGVPITIQPASTCDD